jgi:hypothetical protein
MTAEEAALTAEQEARLAKTDALLEQMAISACERAEKRFARGDRSAILDAIFECNTASIPLPRWAREAFQQAYLETKAGPPLHKSWDDVFGKPHGKGKHLDAKFKARKFQYLVYAAVVEMRKNRPRKTDVFPEVAKRSFERFGIRIGEALCRKYYRRVAKMARLDPARTKTIIEDAIRYELLK